MIVSPLLRGLFGLEANAVTGEIVFAPHVPADWQGFTIGNLQRWHNKFGAALSQGRQRNTAAGDAHRQRRMHTQFQPSREPSRQRDRALP